MRKCKLFLAAAACLCLFLCSGCTQGNETTAVKGTTKPFAVVENYNTQKQPIQLVFAKPPQRVVTFWQNSVETLLALGLGDRVVAAVGVPSPDCLKKEYRAAYAKIPLRQFQPLDTEHLLMLNPDLIIGWYSTFTDRYTRNTEFWQARGINTFMAPASMPGSKEKTVEGQYDYILSIGKIFGREAQAQKIVGQMQKEIDFVQQHTKQAKPQRVLIFEKDKDNLRTYGSQTLAGNILEHVGGKLVPTGPSISYEEIIEANPQVIFLVVIEEDYKTAPQIIQSLYDNPALSDVAAVRDHRIYAVPLYLVYSSATRTYDGIVLMAKALYPDLYKGRQIDAES